MDSRLERALELIHISSLQEDTEGDPQLPTHDQTPSDGSRRVLGSEHWNR